MQAKESNSLVETQLADLSLEQVRMEVAKTIWLDGSSSTSCSWEKSHIFVKQTGKPFTLADAIIPLSPLPYSKRQKPMSRIGYFRY